MATMSAAAFSGDAQHGSVSVRTNLLCAERGAFSGIVCGLRTEKPYALMMEGVHAQ